MGGGLMAKLGSVLGSGALHAAAAGLCLLEPVDDLPRASVAAPPPSPLSVDIRLDSPVSFEREALDSLPLADAADLELAPEGEEPRRNDRFVLSPNFERPLTTRERVPAPEVQAEEAAVEIFNPPPAYPAAARRRGHEGHVLVELRVRADGSVADPRVVECAGSPLFAEAALEAVRAWRYAPLRAERAHRVRFAFKLRA
jgi:periplasmic protein TonB